MSDFDLSDYDCKIAEEKLNNIFRPSDIDGYIGQKDLINRLLVATKASIERDDPLDHIIISGNPGLGKTTIAQIIAKMCGSKFHSITAPSIKSVAELIEVFRDIKKKDVLFLDEIHSLSQRIEECLYSAMEDYIINIKLPNKSIIDYNVQPFCLVAATTQLGRVSHPLRDRFGIIYNMQFYSDEELSIIIKNNFEKINLKTKDDSVYLNIAQRSRGIPRIANRLIRRVRDFAQLFNNNLVDNSVVDKALELEGIDENGFTISDKRYLFDIFHSFAGGPVGLDAISATICEDKATVNDYIEPFLLRCKMITRTKQGRMLTKEGMKYIMENLYGQNKNNTQCIRS